jgi:hypothetical protein
MCAIHYTNWPKNVKYTTENAQFYTLTLWLPNPSTDVVCASGLLFNSSLQVNYECKAQCAERVISVGTQNEIIRFYCWSLEVCSHLPYLHPARRTPWLHVSQSCNKFELPDENCEDTELSEDPQKDL